jgi:hypothetical protein
LDYLTARFDGWVEHVPASKGSIDLFNNGGPHCEVTYIIPGVAAENAD